MDYISREEAIEAITKVARKNFTLADWYEFYLKGMTDAEDSLKALPVADVVERKKGKWIPVSERLPEDLEPVNITWINHEPEPYYHSIKDKNFIATGIYYRGQWYWYSTTCADYLGEYGSNEIDKVDDAVEIVAWMPLPEPYKGV